MNISMKDFKKDKNLKWIVFLLILIIILLVTSIFAVLKMFEINDMRGVAEQDIGLNQSRLNYLKQLEENDEQTRETMAMYNEKLPKDISQDDVLIRLHNLSNVHEVKVQSISFDTVQSANNANFVPLKIIIEGNYEDIMPMLENFCYGNRLSVISNILINKADTEGVVQADVSIAVYMQ